jgi:hypothetical protein
MSLSATLSASGGPARTVRLNPDWGRYERQHRQHLERFLSELEPWMHDRIELERIFRPGPDGQPVWFMEASIAWRPGALARRGLADRARLLLPECYVSFLRKPFRDPAGDPNEERLFRALALYAAASGRDLWIYSFAALFEQHGKSRDDVFELAALCSADAGVALRADYYRRRICNPSPYFELCFQILSGRSASNAEADPGAATVKRLLWLDAAAEGDAPSEHYLIRRMTKNPPIEAADLADLAQQLICRGRLFRAARLALRHARAFGESDYAVRLALNLYLGNGKHLHWLRRFARSTIEVHPRDWFALHFCLARIQAGDRSASLAEQALQNKPRILAPPEEQRLRFQFALEAAAAGESPPAQSDSGDWIDLVQALYLSCAPAAPERLEEENELMAQLVELQESQGGVDVERLDIRLHALFSSARRLRNLTAPAEFLRLAARRSGASFALRLFFARRLHRGGAAGVALELARGAGARSPAAQHFLSELFAAANEHSRAERLYLRLQQRFPQSALIAYNLGLVQERGGRQVAALQSYHRALELDPRLLEARDRIVLCT